MFMQFSDSDGQIKAGMCYSSAAPAQNLLSSAWNDGANNNIWCYAALSGRLSTH